MPLSIRPPFLVALAAVVVAGVVIAYLALRGPSAPGATGQPTAIAGPPSGSTEADTGAARLALDRGNEAFRAGRYEDALMHYRTAARAEPSSAAPQYGIHMAARKLDDAALADSARSAIARLTDTAAARATVPAGGLR